MVVGRGAEGRASTSGVVHGGKKPTRIHRVPYRDSLGSFPSSIQATFHRLRPLAPSLSPSSDPLLCTLVPPAHSPWLFKHNLFPQASSSYILPGRLANPRTAVFSLLRLSRTPQPLHPASPTPTNPLDYFTEDMCCFVPPSAPPLHPPRSPLYRSPLQIFSPSRSHTHPSSQLVVSQRPLAVVGDTTYCFSGWGWQRGRGGVGLR